MAGRVRARQSLTVFICILGDGGLHSSVSDVEQVRWWSLLKEEGAEPRFPQPCSDCNRTSFWGPDFTGRSRPAQVRILMFSDSCLTSNIGFL